MLNIHFHFNNNYLQLLTIIIMIVYEIIKKNNMLQKKNET